MQRPRRRAVLVMRKLLTCTMCSMALVAVLSVPVQIFPSSRDVPIFSRSHRLPTQGELRFRRPVPEQSLTQELAPLRWSKAHRLFHKTSALDALWNPPPNRDFFPCTAPSLNYSSPGKSRGYLLVHANGGLNQMRAGICDMVAIARIINATLVIPELDKHSFWKDSSKFSDIFDEDHFINSLSNDVKVIKNLPKEFSTITRAVKHFRSWSGVDYYRDEIASMWKDYPVIRAAKSDSRLANNNLPSDIQKLRCRACYEALRFAPKIEAMGKLLVDRMRSYGPYIALHLRYEKDMLSFSGCTHDLSPAEADELRMIRENTSYWKVKNIDPKEQRSKGRCPLTPKEVGIFLNALGYPSSTPIYIASGDIYGGESHMSDLQSRYPLLMRKELLASSEELEPFVHHASQMAALDYIVSVESYVFISSYSGNMARAVEGHRRFLGHRRTISPDRKALVRLFDKLEQGTMKEGDNLATRIIELHKQRQGSARKRKGPISGTRGMDRFRSEEAFYVNPLPDCLCQRQQSNSLEDKKKKKYILSEKKL